MGVFIHSSLSLWILSLSLSFSSFSPQVAKNVVVREIVFFSEIFFFLFCGSLLICPHILLVSPPVSPQPFLPSFTYPNSSTIVQKLKYFQRRPAPVIPAL